MTIRSAPAPGPEPDPTTGSYRRRARNYLLDSRFQLKYSGLLIAVAVVISGLTGSVLYATTRAVVRESAKVVEESRKVSEESKKVSDVSRMNIRDLAADSPELLLEFNKEAWEHDRALADHQQVIAGEQSALVRGQRILVASLVGGLALLVLFIGLLGILFTHKVAGPIFKMKRLLRQVGQGNWQVDAHLRRGDELQDFFDTFTQMVAGLRDLERGQMREIEAAMAAIDRGAAPEAHARLCRVHEAMKAAVEG